MKTNKKIFPLKGKEREKEREKGRKGRKKDRQTDKLEPVLPALCVNVWWKWFGSMQGLCGEGFPAEPQRTVVELNSLCWS